MMNECSCYSHERTEYDSEKEDNTSYVMQYILSIARTPFYNLNIQILMLIANELHIK